VDWIIMLTFESAPTLSGGWRQLGAQIRDHPEKRLWRWALLIWLLLFCLNPAANPSEIEKAMTEVVWLIDNLKSIGETNVTFLGAPKIIETSEGRAIEFDGKQDGLVVAAQPLAGFETFTVEIVFRPDANGPREQRFLHLQENDSENRVLIETRLTEDHHWFLDTYIRSGKTDQTLFAEKFTHPVGQWYQAALVFDGSEMRHYVNGVEELSSKITFSPLREGRTSIGVRINQVYWFKGAIRTIRFSPRALHSNEFLNP
jgi:Concanavalin A-like lectin/glucanases superfamily